MLAVVQDQEHLPISQDLRERVDEWLLGTLRYPKSLSHHLGHKFPLREGSELHQPYPVRVGFKEVSCHLQGEACLSRPPRTREGKEPCGGQRLLDLPHLTLSAYEAAPRGRQVVIRGA